ncbi:hypothetical protein ACFWM1_29535 [Nocardia sp. NPDC058379]|uniref:hypothetical protein n=1 Tax=unclassified Nocardia TaxID=2637762 RepID=UPI003646ACCC
MTSVSTVQPGRFERWRVFGAMTVAVGAMALVILASVGVDTDGYRMIIRATARTSLALFLSAFVASSLLALRPGEPTRWLARNRRYLGLSFAMSHGLHLAAIITLATTDPSTFATLTDAGSIIGGGLGYVAIAILTVTSFDRIVAGLGAARWQLIQTVGSWFLWLLFLVTNGGRIPENAWYAVPTALVLLAAALRVVARTRGVAATA